MLLNNNDNFPRTPGGYSIETYEPAIIRKDQRKRAEDLLKLAFSDQKPMTTVKRFIPRVPQVNIVPRPVLNNVQYAPIQNIQPVMYNNANIRKIQIINPNPTNIYRFNNITNIKPVPTVKSTDSIVKNNPFLYQNLMPVNNMNNGYVIQNNNNNLATNPGSHFIIRNFNNQRPQPILRSNSANGFSTAPLNHLVIQKRIITGPNYKLHVYKKNLS